MSLQLIVDKLESIPEALRANYKEVDGKFRLDLDGYEDPAGLKSALEKERLAARVATKAAGAWSSIGKTPEEIQALVEANRKAEEDKLKGAGDFDKLRAQMVEQHTAALSKKDEAVVKMRGNLERYLVDAQAVAAISELNGAPALLLPHVKAAVKVVEDGDQFVTRVVDAAGNPRVNGKGEFLSIKDLVSEMRSSDVYGRAFDATGTSGGGASGGGSSVNGKTMKAEEFNALKPAQRAAVMAKGIQLID